MSIVLAYNSPMDQYYTAHPDDFFARKIQATGPHRDEYTIVLRAACCVCTTMHADV